MAQAVVKCEICNQATGRNVCIECEHLFCNNCKLMHLRMNISQNHTFKDVDEEFKSTVNRKHDMVFLLFCETCGCIASKTCTTRKHNWCNLEGVNFARISELQVEVSEQLESYSKEMQIKKRSISMVESQVQRLERDCQKVREEIYSRGEMLKSTVDEIVSSLTRHNLRKEKKQQDKAKAYIDKLGKLDENLNNLKRQYRRIHDKRIGVGLQNSLQNLKRFVDMYDPAIPFMPSLGKIAYADHYKYKTNYSEEIKNLFDNLYFDIVSESDSDTK
ncbi:unnamed protein product [Mytilus edulis]|uniref:B box-type domain-containing protein n=1 Tax=Mytilus edulis TaxID=6550 RepID=A0A8S3QLJ7_MYTED|nr:unnamed protein product [Mytilus edulis]